MALSDHMKREKAGLLDPKRSPGPVTDKATTGKAPMTGTKSGDHNPGGTSHAGAGGKGAS